MSEKASRVTKIMRVIIIALFASAVVVNAINSPSHLLDYFTGITIGYLLFASRWAVISFKEDKEKHDS